MQAGQSTYGNVLLLTAVCVLAPFAPVAVARESLRSVETEQTGKSVHDVQPSGDQYSLADDPREVEAERPSFPRLRVIAKRRLGPVVMVHRGARAVAPENTLAAFKAAMELGADGVELDIRRTRDDVLVVFHDQTVERLLEGFGEVKDYSARGIRALPPVRWNGRPMSGTVPTLTEVLQLARDRAVLLHLDLKEPGLEEDVASLLEVENLWDHVVSINRANAEKLTEDPRYRPLRYKVPGLYPQRLDLDPDALRAALSQPGEMILVDDPRVAAWILGRSLPKRISSALSRQRAPRFALRERASAEVDNTRHWWESLEASYPHPKPKDLTMRLNSLEADLEVGSPPSEDEARRIATMRAWMAWKLGFLGETSSAVQHSLAAIVMHPTPVSDELYGLDAAMAARSLGRLKAVEAVPVLTQVFLVPVNADPEVRTPRQLWRHWRPRMTILNALGEIHTRASRSVLEQYVQYSPQEAVRFGLPAFEEATRALLAQTLEQDAIEALLRSANSTVRGAALLECLDYPTPARRRALASTTPWAVALPTRDLTDRSSSDELPLSR